MKLVTSCWMNWKRWLPRKCAMLSGEPVRKLSMQMTSLPSREQALAEMRADEAGAAGDQDPRHHAQSRLHGRPADRDSR